MIELEPWRESRLRCVFGHRYRGRVRLVRFNGRDMDGEAFLYPPEHEYDPKTCIVCGLKTWEQESAAK